MGTREGTSSNNTSCTLKSQTTVCPSRSERIGKFQFEVIPFMGWCSIVCPWNKRLEYFGFYGAL
jgi:hypothetical protein